MIRAFLLVAAGGAAGSMLRYGCSLLLHKYHTHPFPLATLLVNLSGCFLIGLLSGWANKWQAGNGLWLLLATGFCGGYTTFSAFALEQVRLWGSGNGLTAAFYMIISVAAGILLCRLGMALTS